MMQNQPISEQELHAFVDGELEAGRAATIAAQLATMPELAAQIAGIRADKAQIARIYGPLIDEPLPAPLLQAVARASAPQRRSAWPRRALWAVAAAAALALLGWFGQPALRGNPTDGLVAEAIAVRGGERQAAQEFTAQTLPPPDARDQILRTTLGVPLKTPNLRKAGFDLVAMGVYGDRRDRASLELVYGDARGRRFTVYLRGPTGGDGFELRQDGAARICVWQNEELSAVMVGEMSSEEILRVASLTYADLNF